MTKVIEVVPYNSKWIEIFNAKAIDRKSMIEMIHPPMESILLDRLKKIEENEQKQQQSEQEAAKQGKK